jgi:hypothetical protein
MLEFRVAALRNDVVHVARKAVAAKPDPARRSAREPAAAVRVCPTSCRAQLAGQIAAFANGYATQFQPRRHRRKFGFQRRGYP